MKIEKGGIMLKDHQKIAADAGNSFKNEPAELVGHPYLDPRSQNDECPKGGKHNWKIRKDSNKGLSTMVGGDKIFDCTKCDATKTDY